MSTDSFVFKWILQAEELFKKGSLEKADNIFAKVLKRDEKCVAALNGRGRISEALGFNDRATEFFQKAVSILKILALEFKIIGQYLEYKK